MCKSRTEMHEPFAGRTLSRNWDTFRVPVSMAKVVSTSMMLHRYQCIRPSCSNRNHINARCAMARLRLLAPQRTRQSCAMCAAPVHSIRPVNDSQRNMCATPRGVHSHLVDSRSGLSGLHAWESSNTTAMHSSSQVRYTYTMCPIGRLTIRLRRHWHGLRRYESSASFIRVVFTFYAKLPAGRHVCCPRTRS